MMNIEQEISNHEGTATTRQQHPNPTLPRDSGAKKRRRWWLMALAAGAGLVLGWQAATLAGRMLGHTLSEVRDATVPGPQTP
jgi:hypothetical protein